MMKMMVAVAVVLLGIVAIHGELYSDVMLLGGKQTTNMMTGQLMVPYKEGWELVCDSNFTQTEAEVACKEFHPGFTYVAFIKGSAYGSSFQYNITTVQCNGTEERVSQCAIDNAGTCSSGHYVSLACSAVPFPQTENELSILGDSTTFRSSGPLELSHLGFTGLVCADSWDDQDATVACRELSSFSSGIAYSHYPTGDTTNVKYLTSEFQCNGTEGRLLDCPHIETGNVSQCRSGFYAGVVCFKPQDGAMTFRLRRADNHFHQSDVDSGRVEVKVHSWGALCATTWSSTDAQVFCRSLNFTGGQVQDVSEEFAPHNGPLWDPYFMCTGKETDLNQCPHHGWEQVHSCHRLAGATCYGKATTTSEGTTEPNASSTTATTLAVPADIMDIDEHAATTEADPFTEAVMQTTVAQETAESSADSFKCQVICPSLASAAVVLVVLVVVVVILRRKRDSIRLGQLFNFKVFKTPSPPEPTVTFGDKITIISMDEL